MVITNKVFKSGPHTTLRFFHFNKITLLIGKSCPGATTNWASGTKRGLELCCITSDAGTNVSRLDTCAPVSVLLITLQ